jgi:hypothetical protein
VHTHSAGLDRPIYAELMARGVADQRGVRARQAGAARGAGGGRPVAAGGNIAHQLVAQGPADGSVILLGSVGPLAIAPHLTKVGYDPQKDLAPLTMGMNFPTCWWCRPAWA